MEKKLAGNSIIHDLDSWIWNPKKSENQKKSWNPKIRLLPLEYYVNSFLSIRNLSLYASDRNMQNIYHYRDHKLFWLKITLHLNGFLLTIFFKIRFHRFRFRFHFILFYGSGSGYWKLKNSGSGHMMRYSDCREIVCISSMRWISGNPKTPFQIVLIV